MSEQKSAEVFLPSNAHPTHYDLTLVPCLEKFVFQGFVDIQIQVTEATSVLKLHALELEFDAAGVWISSGVRGKKGALGDNATAVSFDDPSQTASLTFAKQLAVGEYTLSIRFNGVLNGVHFFSMLLFLNTSLSLSLSLSGHSHPLSL